jgi:FixJ family two-component response regulator
MQMMRQKIFNENGFQIPLITIVDDDESLRDSILSLLRSVGFRVQAFVSAEDLLLHADVLHKTSCLIVDIRMPGMSGLELHSKLNYYLPRIPTIYITGHSDEKTRAQALKEGAMAILNKPFTEDALLGSIELALKKTNHPS